MKGTNLDISNKNQKSIDLALISDARIFVFEKDCFGHILSLEWEKIVENFSLGTTAAMVLEDTEISKVHYEEIKRFNAHFANFSNDAELLQQSKSFLVNVLLKLDTEKILKRIEPIWDNLDRERVKRVCEHTCGIKIPDYPV